MIKFEDDKKCQSSLGGLDKVPKSVPSSGEDWPMSSDVSVAETTGDSSAASGSHSSYKLTDGSEWTGVDSSFELYWIGSDGENNDSDSDVTLAVDNTFEKLEKAYKVLKHAVKSHN